MAKAQRAISTTSSEAITISDKQRKGRAVNAVADLLQRRLLVPKVYLEPKSFVAADVLAVDRAGSGDVHGVHIQLALALRGLLTSKLCEERLRQVSLPYIMDSDFHFKYIAVEPAFVDFLSKQNLFAKDGIGRIGIIEIIESPNALPEARIAVPAERFRVAPDKIAKFDNFQKKTPADMEIRG
jgi:hypothetical protein